MAIEIVPGNARMLGAYTGVGTEVLWKGNLERHEGYRGRLWAGLLEQLLLHGGRLMLLLKGREMELHLLLQMGMKMILQVSLLRVGMMMIHLLLVRGGSCCFREDGAVVFMVWSGSWYSRRGSAHGWRWTNRHWYRRRGMGRRLVEDGEGHILQLFLDLTNLSDQLDTVVADYCRCSLLWLGVGRNARDVLS